MSPASPIEMSLGHSAAAARPPDKPTDAGRRPAHISARRATSPRMAHSRCGRSVHQRASACISVHLRASACICVHLRASACICGRNSFLAELRSFPASRAGHDWHPPMVKNLMKQPDRFGGLLGRRPSPGWSAMQTTTHALRLHHSSNRSACVPVRASWSSLPSMRYNNSQSGSMWRSRKPFQSPLSR